MEQNNSFNRIPPPPPPPPPSPRPIQQQVYSDYMPEKSEEPKKLKVKKEKKQKEVLAMSSGQKKFLGILISAVLASFIFLTATCLILFLPVKEVQLGTPVLTLQTNKVIWGKVENAVWYEVFFDNEYKFKTNKTEIFLNSFSDYNRNVIVKVRAVTNGKFQSGEFSDVVTVFLN